MVKLKIQIVEKNAQGVSVVKKEIPISFPDLPPSIEQEVISHIIKNAQGLSDNLRKVAES